MHHSRTVEDASDSEPAPALSSHLAYARRDISARNVPARASHVSGAGGGRPPPPPARRASAPASTHSAAASRAAAALPPAAFDRSTSTAYQEAGRAALSTSHAPGDHAVIIDLRPITSVLDAAYCKSSAEIGYETTGHLCLKDEDYDVAATTDASLLYGEVLPIGVVRMLDNSHLRAHAARRLFDLGMGTGKLCMQAWLMYTNLVEVHGIELAPSRYVAAETAALRLVARSGRRYRIHKLVRGREVAVCEDAGPHINSDDLADASIREVHTRCVSCAGPSRCRVLHLRCGNLFDITPSELRRADIIVMETDLPDASHPRICRFVAMCKRRARLLTYLNLRAIWPQNEHPAFMPCPLRQVASNVSLTDRFATSWAFQTGHHFFLWKCIGELPSSQLIHPVPMYLPSDADDWRSSTVEGEDDVMFVVRPARGGRDERPPSPDKPAVTTLSRIASHVMGGVSGGGGRSSRGSRSGRRHAPHTSSQVADDDMNCAPHPAQAGVLVSQVVQDDDGEMLVEERYEDVLPVSMPTHLSHAQTIEVPTEGHERSRGATDGPPSPPGSSRGSLSGRASISRASSSRLVIRVQIVPDWAVECSEDDLVVDERGYIVGIRLRSSETTLSATTNAATTAATLSLSAAISHRDRAVAGDDGLHCRSASVTKSTAAPRGSFSRASNDAFAFAGRRRGSGFDADMIRGYPPPDDDMYDNDVSSATMSGGAYGHDVKKKPKTGWRYVRSSLRQAFGIPKRTTAASDELTASLDSQ